MFNKLRYSVQAAYNIYRGRLIVKKYFDGEKTFGDLGAPKELIIEKASISVRAWQTFVESEVMATIVEKYCLWMIGKGLKLQCEPRSFYLKSLGINLDVENFTKNNESRFNVWADSKICSYDSLSNFSELSNSVFKNSFIAGDVLVVLHYIDDQVKVQLIDSSLLCTPFNQKINAVGGIEKNSRGEHIAFHYRNNLGSTNRVPAKNKFGDEVAFLVVTRRLRIGDDRGISALTSFIETAKKLDRYSVATLGSAEERAKNPFYIHHGEGSTGRNPLANAQIHAINLGGNTNKNVVSQEDLDKSAAKIATTVNKQVINMPVGADLRQLESKNELYFDAFFNKYQNIIASGLGIPPDVAMSMYNGSFSASRAAIEDWKLVLNIKRSNHSSNFEQKVYDFWFKTEVAKGFINAVGYMAADLKKDILLKSAFTKSKWLGANVAHIDPLKEANAQRVLLGPLGANIPLTTGEEATEHCTSGNYDSNKTQFDKEISEFPVKPKE